MSNSIIQKIEYNIILRFKIFKEATIFKIKLKKDNIEEILKNKNQIKNIIPKELEQIKLLKQMKKYKKVEILFKDVKIFMKIGVEDILLTAYLTAFISTIISIFYELKVKNEKEFKIEPIFVEENNIELILNGKAGIYMKDIIYLVVKNISIMNKKI